ncbi:MAG: glycosyltransferase family 4 protein [Sphingobacteriales bacterium]|nr:glycosyltransferase family 4 protein [Sphingobacteriales bacterium]
MRLLWLASWYPNQVFPFNGDFVKRHACAASLFNNIDVIHICRDEKGKVTKTIKEEFAAGENLTEKIIYYHSVTTGINFIDRVFSSLVYRKLFKKAITQYIIENGKPDLVHVQVTMNAGLLALWIKKEFGIDYVVTEHWSGLLPEAQDNFYKQSAAVKILWKKIADNAKSLSVVSRYLGDTINEKIINKEYVVIPNVVNTAIFKPVPKSDNNLTTFIHISRLDYQKNPEAIFKAFHLLKQMNEDFRLIIFSNETEIIKRLSKQYRLENKIEHYSEVGQEQLVKKMQQADALILFSRYETFGCVVAEANACGLPVIVSDIPTMHELVDDKVNGIFASNENAEDLAQKLLWYLQNKNAFATSEIADETNARYSYTKVGKQFNDWYHHVLAK